MNAEAELRGHFAERAAIFIRHYLDETSAERRPVVEDPARLRAGGQLGVLLDQALEQGFVGHSEVTHVDLAVAFELVA